MNRKFIISLGILLFSSFSILLLSKQPILLSALLIFTAYAKHKIYPIKQELIWFILISVGGSTVEILLVNFAKAWNYADPQFFGLPVWMSLYWGVVGTTIVVLYEGFTKKS